MNRYEHLLSPYKIGSLTIKNRFVVCAMGNQQYNAKGGITPEGIQYFTEFAKGGFGLVTTNGLAVDNVVDDNTMLDRLLPTGHRKNFIVSCNEMTERVHSHGAKMFVQLSLGVGRNSRFKSASPNPFFFNPEKIAGELTKEEIQKKLDCLAEAAERSQIAGFDGIQIHALHYGYLLDQFALSLTNRRTDEYGGALENRLRFTREALEVVKKTCGKNYPVTMKLGLKSFVTGLGKSHASLTGEDEAGRTIEEGVEICKYLENFGFDGLECDFGIYEAWYHQTPPMYTPKCAYLPLLEQAKAAVSIPVIGCERMNDFDVADKAIAEGKIDAIGLGRPALADPHLPRKIAMGRPESIRPCLACCQCIGSEMRIGGYAGCAVNPAVNRGCQYEIKKACEPKKVVVVGGGVSGMEAALTAKISGHDVTLLEAGDKLGGNLIAAGNHSFKGDVRDLNQWFQRELNARKVDIRMNTKASPELVQELGADIVLEAVGSSVIMPRIQGIDHPKCLSCMDVLEGGAKVGETIVVVGGGLTGVEMAIDYAMEGKKVTVVEALNDILSSGLPVPMMQDMMIRDLLKHYQVDVRTGYAIAEVNDDGAVIRATNSPDDMVTIPADTVVMAIGFRPRPSMQEALYGSGIEVHTIGDANRVGSIKTSIWDAYEVARDL